MLKISLPLSSLLLGPWENVSLCNRLFQLLTKSSLYITQYTLSNETNQKVPTFSCVLLLLIRTLAVRM